MEAPVRRRNPQYERNATPSSADDLGSERFRLTGPDVASFISLCRENGIAAEPQVNTAEDHVDMWVDRVDQIVNELGYDLRYVAAGNEPDIDISRSPWSLYSATTLDEALASYTGRHLGAARHQRANRLRPAPSRRGGPLLGPPSPPVAARTDPDCRTAPPGRHHPRVSRRGERAQGHRR